MTTRDSKAWIVAAIGTYCGALASNPERLEKIVELDRQAILSEVCQLCSLVAMTMFKSPLPLSEAGREKYQEDTVKLKP